MTGPSLTRARWLGAGMLLGLAACGAPARFEAFESAASDCGQEAPRALGDEPPFVLVNAYYLQDEAARELRAGATRSAVVEEVFTKASALGVRVVRTNGFNDAPGSDSAIQRGPGVYDEASLRALDVVLARARDYGLRLVLPLGNAWDAYGGARQYVAWAGLKEPLTGDPRFFTDRRAIALYEGYVSMLLGRVNTVDGIRYGEHPAVLAWELLNEPRNQGLDPEGNALRAWVDEVGERVKRLAPEQRVGTGEEGFDTDYGARDADFWRQAAPGLLGAGHYRNNLASPWIDFGSVHFYPEPWGADDDGAAKAGARWISWHAEAARWLGKPLVVSEFGLSNRGAFPLEQRRLMYRGWLRCIRDAGAAGGGPWMLANDARPDEWDDYTFHFRDRTWPADPVNRYADLLLEASRRLSTP